MSTSVVGQREHVGRRRHLDDQRRERDDAADAGEADRGDVEEVAAADSVFAGRTCGCGNLSGSCLGGHHSPFDAMLLHVPEGT